MEEVKTREKGMTPGTTKYKSRVRNNKRKLATTSAIPKNIYTHEETTSTLYPPNLRTLVHNIYKTYQVSGVKTNLISLFQHRT